VAHCRCAEYAVTADTLVPIVGCSSPGSAGWNGPTPGGEEGVTRTVTTSVLSDGVNVDEGSVPVVVLRAAFRQCRWASGVSDLSCLVAADV
jgi:hypothetical protein